MHALMEVERTYLRQDVPEFRAGDTVRVQVRVKEGDKERLQAFQGVVIARCCVRNIATGLRWQLQAD